MPNPRVDTDEGADEHCDGPRGRDRWWSCCRCPRSEGPLSATEICCRAGIVLAAATGLCACAPASAQNPILPSWEYIPDGEPRVFGDRVYLYGSHDKAGSERYCDHIYKVWSAPLSNLAEWRMESESFRTRPTEHGPASVGWSQNELYAPDVVKNHGKYWLYAYIVGAPAAVAVSDTPGGPFTTVSKINAPPGSPNEFGGWGQYIDPGVLVDDDGRVYIYWGYKSSHMAELNAATMVDVLPGTYQADIIPREEPFVFFEACSPRKIGDTYYLIYAKGHRLVYTTSKSPRGPFAYGGIIVQNAGDMPGGNIHGSICEINGQWYVFYHRHTNKTGFSRRACVERIAIEPDGSIREVEQTSLGFATSLDPYRMWNADIICVQRGGNYVTELDEQTHPVMSNKHGSVAGYKYFDFGAPEQGRTVPLTLELKRNQGVGAVEIWLDEVGTGKRIDGQPVQGTLIGRVEIGESVPTDRWSQVKTTVPCPSGRRAVLFRFVADDKNASLCDLRSFGFATKQ